LKPWELWDSPLFGGHPCVIVSNEKRVERKNKVVVLKCTTLRAGTPHQPNELQTTLDQEDGMDTTTLCECDLLYTLAKADLKNRRGEVSFSRRGDISRKIIQGLAIAGL
jgi:mRNA-degrading endonuclease toxin of MazEF toxin-antitoxin module